MRVSLSLLGVALTVAVAGCSSNRPITIVSPFSPVPPTAVIYRDDSGGLRDSAQYVIRDEAAWVEMWTQITETQLNPPERPAVDFATNMVLALAAGRMRAGDQIHVDSVGVRNNVYVAFASVVEACEALDVEVYPLEIVRVARSDREVQFQLSRRRATGC
jgi:hypothetical protein